MMTDRWLNVVLAVAVTIGLATVAVYERPRAAEERAELLGQEVQEVDADDDGGSADGEGSDPFAGLGDAGSDAASVGDDDAALDEFGVSASHPVAVEVGMAVMESGGNAVDAAIAVSYALGVVEPFGSGVGGGGALLLHEPGQEPVGYDYRETAPQSGELPSAEIGVPGFVAGMEHIHEQHATMALEDLIEPAAALAEDGVEVTGYLHERLRGAAHRLPIHQLPRLFPDGEAIDAGEQLQQPEHAETLRRIQEHGSEVLYDGELGERIVEEVSGLEPEDFEAYEVVEVDPATGVFGDLDVISGGPPVSGATLVQFLQTAEALGVGDLDPDSASHHHALAQAYRLAIADRTEHIADPSAEEVPLEELLDLDRAEALADAIPDDGFVDGDAVQEAGADVSAGPTDTTHFVVVDPSGAMVSATNTLGNFFGSGLVVEGLFLNDQLKNFARDPDSINAPAPGKRPRSYITPTIVADGDVPLLGLGSSGGRRIPMAVGQTMVRWAAHGQTLADAADAPRIHLEGRELYVEEEPDDVGALTERGYEVLAEAPVPEFYGGVQALQIDHADGTITGYADDRREGSWTSRGR